MAQSLKNAEERWQCNKTLPESLSYLLDKDLLTDVTFLVGPAETRISAHKLILASRSPVFYAMFEGPLAESGDIMIPDIEPVTFDALLRYFYSDVISVDASNVNDLLYAAEKYDVDAIKQECERFLVENITDDPLGFFELAEKYGLKDVRLQTLKIICKTPSEYVGEDCTDYLRLPRESFHKLLVMDELCLPEIQVYFSAIRWAEEECRRQKLGTCDENIRRVLGPTLYTIRFPIMSQAEFCTEVSNRKILSQEEIIHIFQSLSLPTHSQVDKKFNLSPRERCSPESRCYRFLNYANNWGYNGAQDALSFQVNSSTYLKGVILYAGMNTGDHYTYDVSILDGKENVIASIRGEHTSTASELMYEVRFCSHVKLSPESIYTVTALINGPFSWHGMDGKSEINFGENNFIKFFDSTKSTNKTRVLQGQFAGFIL